MRPSVSVAVPTATFLDAVPTLLSSAVFAIATVSVPSASISNFPTGTESIAAAITTASAAISGSENGPHEPPPSGECKLLGPFALIVQGALGGLALLALVYKRWRERPQRPLKIWTFDVSKQVVGSVLVHIANLVMSLLSSGQLSIKVGPQHVSRSTADVTTRYVPNPCSFYLLNLAIDTTIGIPILIILLRIFTALFAMTPIGNPPESIQSGNYGHPPKAWWWFKQSMIYFLGLMGMKICVLIIFILLPWISRIGDWALRWTEGNEELQVFFVMLFFPVVMNATQYYIIDSFIKNQKPSEHEPVAGEDTDSDDDSDGSDLFDDPTLEDMEGLDSDEEDKLPQREAVEIKANEPTDIRGGVTGSGLKDRHNYDPKFDGESSPTVVGSASNSEREQPIGKEAGSDGEAKSGKV